MNKKRISIVRDKNNDSYLFIKLSIEELDELGKDIQGFKIIMEKSKED